MALPSAPPRFSSWADLVSSITKGETGWRVFALQHALTSLGQTTAPDGDFGPNTERQVKVYQAVHGLVVDGIVGARTQMQMLAALGSRTHDRLPDVPDGLMRGLAEGEGASVLAATNWSVPGGVDCGCMQYRVLGPPYAPAQLKRAFDPLGSMVAAGTEFLYRAHTFERGAWVQRQSNRTEWGMRIAILAHNWPAGASAVAATGQPSSPGAVATWVAAGTKFPDGTPVRTRSQWCQFYALGGPHGEGRITKYVTDWS